MKLDKNRKLVRWAYFWRARPDRTTLCAFFWHVVLLSPIAGLIFVAISPIYGGVWLLNRYVAPILTKWDDRRRQRVRDRWKARMEKALAEEKHKTVEKGPSALQVLWQGLKAVKGKVCPLIIIE